MTRPFKPSVYTLEVFDAIHEEVSCELGNALTKLCAQT